MQLQIAPDKKNSYPVKSIFIKDSHVAVWLAELKQMGLGLSGVEVYPLAGTEANSIWGCLVILVSGKMPEERGKHLPAQSVNDKIYLPVYTSLHPNISIEEVNAICKDKRYAFHPDFGLAELDNEVDWNSLLDESIENPLVVIAPADSVYIPWQLKRLMVKEVPPEEVLKQMDAAVKPTEKMEEKPLSVMEKLKMNLLKKVVGDGPGEGTMDIGEGSGFWSMLDKLLPAGTSDGIRSKWQGDLKDLEERNKQEFEKLMEMLRKNPLEGLKYAMPLDFDGSSRGHRNGEDALFQLSKLWSSFAFLGALLPAPEGGGGIATLPVDSFWQLQQQYEQTAQELINRKDYRKAAFVYIKLLKNYQKAAETLEAGRIYDEAAAVYLKHLNNKQKAAECYEKGNIIEAAIKLQKELEAFEKVGDLYAVINMRKEANEHYGKEIERYMSKTQHVKAALIYKNKMNEIDNAAELLLEGWRKNADAVNCLNNYFALYHGSKKLTEKISMVYANGEKDINKLNFFHALKSQYGQSEEVNELSREIAFEIVAEHATTYPALLDDLKIFKPNDKLFVKDVMKYRTVKR